MCRLGQGQRVGKETKEVYVILSINPVVCCFAAPIFSLARQESNHYAIV